MNTLNLFLCVIAFCISGLIVYYQYYYKQPKRQHVVWLSLLRFISLVGILLLLINPKFESNHIEIVKPLLLVGVDDSKSISYAEKENEIKSFRQLVIQDKEINDRFDLKIFNFAKGISTDTTLTFKEENTDIYNTLEGLNAFASNQLSPIVLLTDGNQTYGKNYVYMNSSNPVFPVIIGDTIVNADIEISKVNVNAYASLDNSFEVEVFLNSNVDNKLDSRLLVTRNGVEVYSEKVSFSSLKQSERIGFFLKADSIGMQLYKAELLPFTGEMNPHNNVKNFGIEILDEQTEIAIVYDKLHPDLGMLKRTIETNKQRKVNLIPIAQTSTSLKENTLVLLYQPNGLFKDLINTLEEKNANYILITGPHTDWNFLNSSQTQFSKESSGLVENTFPEYDNNFSTFYTEDLSFESFPPLKTIFGAIRFSIANEVLLYQRINDMSTKIPLLTVYNNRNAKRVVLFGAGIWKWRAHSFNKEGTFEKFDNFFNSLVQYVQLSERNELLQLMYEPVYNANESIRIQVKKYDANLNVSLNSNLQLQLSDDGEVIPFYLRNNLYEAVIDDIQPGNYNFKVVDQETQKEKRGSFVVAPFSAEQEKINPDSNQLKLLANRSGGAAFYEDQFEDLRSNLLENESFKPLQKERNNLISLIDWKWLLGLIILSLSLEWFLRKYRGMI